MSVMKVNPTLTDVLNNFKEEIFETLNCHAIAEVVSVDRENDFANLKMIYKKRFIFVDESGKISNNIKDYPILVDCPIISISGGGAGLYMPIESGDKALVLFNDRDIDNFISGDTKGYPETSRKHSFSDAIALVGLKNDVSRISSTEFKSDAVLFNGESKISIGDKINISNQQESLLVLISDLIDAITQLTVTVGSSTSSTPVNGPAFNLIKTRVEGLLK